MLPAQSAISATVSWPSRRGASDDLLPAVCAARHQKLPTTARAAAADAADASSRRSASELPPAAWQREAAEATACARPASTAAALAHSSDDGECGHRTSTLRATRASLISARVARASRPASSLSAVGERGDLAEPPRPRPLPRPLPRPPLPLPRPRARPRGPPLPPARMPAPPRPAPPLEAGPPPPPRARPRARAAGAARAGGRRAEPVRLPARLSKSESLSDEPPAATGAACLEARLGALRADLGRAPSRNEPSSPLLPLLSSLSQLRLPLLPSLSLPLPLPSLTKSEFSSLLASPFVSAPAERRTRPAVFPPLARACPLPPRALGRRSSGAPASLPPSWPSPGRRSKTRLASA